MQPSSFPASASSPSPSPVQSSSFGAESKSYASHASSRRSVQAHLPPSANLSEELGAKKDGSAVVKPGRRQRWPWRRRLLPTCMGKGAAATALILLFATIISISLRSIEEGEQTINAQATSKPQSKIQQSASTIPTNATANATISTRPPIVIADSKTGVGLPNAGASQPTAALPESNAVAPADLSSFRVCRVPTKDKRDYICEGSEYDAFGRRMDEYLRNAQNGKGNDLVATPYPPITQQWGRRQHAFPDNAIILMLGNSHTRQMVAELLCQYQDDIVREESMVQYKHRVYGVIGRSSTGTTEDGNDGASPSSPNATWYHAFDTDRMGNYHRATFSNNATFLAITNSFLVHLENCCAGPDNPLEYILDVPLSDLSAMLVGKFNNIDNSKKTNFQKTLEEVWHIDLANSPPIQMERLAQIYHGPLIAFSMFAQYANTFGNQTQHAIERMAQSRSNARFVNVRRHIAALGECSSTAKRLTVGICDDSNPNGHRCSGAHGGHPTLGAWDAMEAVHDILGQSST